MKSINKMSILTLSLLILLSSCLSVQPQKKQIKAEKITFPSLDEVTITADLYLSNNKDAPFIILYHQAYSSRGEYEGIAPKLVEMGFNCMAIDQRSRNHFGYTGNETMRSAADLEKPMYYTDAIPDLISSFKHVEKNYANGKILIWGSSYSAALSLRLAVENVEKVDGVLSFSPGEYFEKLGKSKTFITENVEDLNCPVFITSAKNEKSKWESIYNAIPSKDKIFFLPETRGNHGSRALWGKFDDSKDYWEMVTKFLHQYFPVK